MSNGVQLSVLNGLLNGLPIFNGDFADPYALVDGDSVYAYATSTTASAYAPAAHIPVIAITRATGFAGHYLGDALPTVPAWTVAGFQWAPSVWERPDGTFVMYYSTPAAQPLDCLAKVTDPGCVTTTHGANTAMCISRATSISPSGPFVDDSSSAFICPTAQGGAIDPSIFVATNGTPWLLWKADGDCCNLPTHIYSQQLSADGLSTVGPPHELIGATQAWEGGLVEAPSMVQSGNTFWLFYSANLWGTPNYSIGIAKCASVTGPCTKPLDKAWHTSTNQANGQGYGGSEFFVAGGGLVWMVHHGLVPGQSGDYAERRLYVDLMVFPKKGLPSVAPRAPAAALAVEALYYQDPDLPSQAQAAYLHMVSIVPGNLHGRGQLRRRSATAGWRAPTSLTRKASAPSPAPSGGAISRPSSPTSWASSQPNTSVPRNSRTPSPTYDVCSSAALERRVLSLSGGGGTPAAAKRHRFGDVGSRAHGTPEPMS